VNPPGVEVAGAARTALVQANGAQFQLLGGERLHIHNGSGAPITATLVSVADAQGRPGDYAEAIANGADLYIGPLKTAGWRQSDGMAYVDVSANGLTAVLLAP